MEKIEFIEYECEVVTPMFIGDADPLKAKLRATSLKGVLRFWWRALNGGLPIDELRKKEGELFGNTQQQSKIRIDILDNELVASTIPFPAHYIPGQRRINVINYLAYGTTDKEYFEPGKFTLRIGCPEEQRQAVEDALSLLTNFGGLGARSRNGFGSLSIKHPSIQSNPVTLLKELPLPDGKMQYSALSQGIKFFRTTVSHRTWDSALAELGRAYHSARKSLEPSNEYEKRKFLASPLIVGRNTHSDIQRRAKPYFMHVAKVEDKYEGRMLYLPAAFCAGLEKDDSGRAINHQMMDERFTAVCASMNKHLSGSLEVVL